MTMENCMKIVIIIKAMIKMMDYSMKHARLVAFKTLKQVRKKR